MTFTVPPCAATAAPTMDSPSPVLPVAREREESPRAKRSNTCASRSGGTPGPSSTTDKPTCPSTGVRVTETVVPSGYGYACWQQVGYHLRRISASSFLGKRG